MSKTIQERGLKDTQSHIQKEYQLGRKLGVKVGSIITILLFTGCTTKDINLDPISTVANQLIKVIKDNK